MGIMTTVTRGSSSTRTEIIIPPAWVYGTANSNSSIITGMEAGGGGTTRQLKPHVKNRRN
jgi:hypothetical protein